MQSLGEGIGKVRFGVDVFDIEFLGVHKLANADKVTLHMFHAGDRLRVKGESNRTLVVAPNEDGDHNIVKEGRHQPLDVQALACGRIRGNELCLSARTRGARLLGRLPCDRCTAKHDQVGGRRRTNRPGGVRVGEHILRGTCQRGEALGNHIDRETPLVNNAKVTRTPQIAKDVVGRGECPVGRAGENAAKLVDRKGDVGSPGP